MGVRMFTGDEESLLRDAVAAYVDELVGDGDRSLMVDEFDDPDAELSDVVASANTPPMFTPTRVVVVRDVGRFSADDVKPLVAYLAEPNDTTSLVLVAGGGRAAKSLTDAIAGAGGDVVATSAPFRAKDRPNWIGDQATRHGVRLDRATQAALAEHFGENVAAVSGLLDTLSSTFGSDATLGVGDVRPFLGERGGIPPWDLTDAIDRGDTRAAIDVLSRMTGGGGRHPLQVMAILHGHYVRLAKLDGSGATDEATAASALGIKPGFPARKALAQHRALGGGRVRRAIEMLAAADLDLRGQRELPEDLVLEVLVARLSRLAVAAA